MPTIFYRFLKALPEAQCPGKPAYEELESQVKKLKVQNELLDRRYRGIIDNSTDAILLTSPDGPIFFANKAACGLFQMTEQELIEGGRFAVQDKNDPRLKKVLIKIPIENQAVTIENRVYDAHGNVRWLQFINRGFFMILDR